MPVVKVDGQVKALRTLILTLGGASLYMASFDSHMFSPDDLQRYRLSTALALRGFSALRHSGGISKYPPLLSLLGALPIKLGIAWDHGSPGVWASRLATMVSIVACTALIPIFLTIARTLGIGERLATVATVLFTISNPLWPYSKRFLSEPLSAALCLGAFAGVLIYVRTNRRGPLIGGLLCLAVLPLNNMVVPVALTVGLLLFAWLDHRRGLALAIGAAFGCGALAAVGMLIVRFGGIAKGGYDNEGFTFHIIDALHGLLFGPGRSIFLFAPMTFLALFGWRALARWDRGFAFGALAAVIVCLGINGCWWAWYGGVCFGPRLMLPVLPLASVGALALFQQPRRWLIPAGVVVGLFGLYVQILGAAFSQDYDIYYYLKPDYSNESLAWFDPGHSDLLRIPRHFRDQPWDFSSDFLTLKQRDPSTVNIDGQPVRQVRIVQENDAQFSWWTITDIFAIVRKGASERRVPVGQLGATLEAYNHQDGRGALDGNPRTRWTSGVTRFDGMSVTLDFGQVRNDIVRLELTHLPSENDFPSALGAQISVGNGTWTPVPAMAATPLLVWNPAIWILALCGVLLLLLGLALPAGRPRAVAAAPA